MQNTNNVQNDFVDTHEDEDEEVLTRVQNPYYSDRYDTNSTIRLEILQQSKNIYYESSQDTNFHND